MTRFGQNRTIAIILSLCVMGAIFAQMETVRCEEKAVVLYQSGVSLFREKKYVQAANAFREAYALKPSWKLFYNIGQCEASARRYGSAIEAFEAYLVGGGDEIKLERTEYVVGEIRRLQTLVGRLELTAPPGIDVYLDDTKRGTTPLEGPLRVAVGKHHLVLKKGETSVLEKRVQIAGGIATQVTLDASEMTTPNEDATPPPLPTDDMGTKKKTEPPLPILKKKHSWMWPAGLAGMAGGAAMLIGGTVTGSLALSKANRLSKNCSDKVGCSHEDKELKESSDRLAMTTNVLLPVGGAIAVAGGVLFFIEIKRQSKETRAVQVQPIGNAHQMGMIITGRF